MPVANVFANGGLVHEQDGDRAGHFRSIPGSACWHTSAVTPRRIRPWAGYRVAAARSVRAKRRLRPTSWPDDEIMRPGLRA
jgi:hypothetical protein